jgi:hypothetical protein
MVNGELRLTLKSQIKYQLQAANNHHCLRISYHAEITQPCAAAHQILLCSALNVLRSRWDAGRWTQRL